MTRVGPNQDINDPTTIIQLAYIFQNKSDTIGDYYAKSVAQSAYVTGPPIVDVFIPFNKTDGSIQDLFGKDIIEDNGGYIYDTNLVSNSVINTYINLAERFRSDWELIRSAAQSLQDFDDVLNTGSIDPLPSAPDLGFNPEYATSGTMGGTYYDYEYTIFGKSIPDIPIWFGDGPISYNNKTYPQLNSGINNISVTMSHVLSPIETVYFWRDFYSSIYEDLQHDHDIQGFNVLGDSTDDQISDGLIQIPNFSDSSVTVNITGESSYQRSSTTSLISKEEFVRVISSVAIGSYNFLPQPWEFVEEVEFDRVPTGSHGGPTSASLSISHEREVTIPPNQSAFIFCGAHFRGKIGPVNVNRAGGMEGFCFIEVSAPDGTKNRSTTISLDF